MPRLTPAQQRQLQSLARNEGPVNLGTVRALMDRGLVEDTPSTRDDLRIHCRLRSSYPLTAAGRETAKALEDRP